MHQSVAASMPWTETIAGTASNQPTTCSRKGKPNFNHNNVTAAIDAAYQRDEDDEFVQASLVGSESDTSAIVSDGDVVVFMNFRADRAREITRAFVDDNFDGFQRSVKPKLANS